MVGRWRGINAGQGDSEESKTLEQHSDVDQMSECCEDLMSDAPVL
jgi:hypothetical protein